MNAAAGRRLSPRHRARRVVLQALYQWIMSGADPQAIARQVAADAANGADAKKGKAGPGAVDWDYFHRLFPAVAEGESELRRLIAPVMDERKLDPVEQSIVWLGAHELAGQPDVPSRVVINECVELAKDFGATDGHKYINAVLDKLAPRLRPGEAESTGCRR